jgi:hypothetical protein
VNRIPLLSEFSAAVHGRFDNPDAFRSLLGDEEPLRQITLGLPEDVVRTCAECGQSATGVTAVGVKVAYSSREIDGSVHGWLAADRPRDGWRWEPCGHVIEEEWTA